MPALRVEDLRRLAGRYDSQLGSLERKYLRQLLGELRLARGAVNERLLRADIQPYETWRLTGLEQELDRLLADLRGRLVRPLQDHVAAAAGRGDRFALAALGKAAVAGAFSLVNTGALAHLISYNYGLVKGLTDQVRGDIMRQLVQGVLQGESMPDIAKRLVQGTALDPGPWARVETRAAVIARTETIRAYSLGAQAQYRAFGVRRGLWLTGRDERVCDTCGPLDGQLFPLDSLPGGGPPLHPNCRCAVAPDVAETEDEARARDEIAARNFIDWQRRMAA